VIGKIIKGKSFSGLFRYLLKEDKGAEIICSGAFGETCDELAMEFELICSLNPRVEIKATHLSLAFAEEDGQVPIETKVRIGQRVIEELGYSNSSYVLIDHGRKDPGHLHEHNHDHCHLVLSNVDRDGKRVDVWRNYPRLEKILREIEKEEGLRQIPSSWELKGKSAPSYGQRRRFDREVEEGKEAALPVSDRLQAAINAAAEESRSVGELAQRLAHQDIETRLNITRNGEIRGISYQMEGVKFQGSQLYDASAPKLESVHGLRKIKGDIESIHNINRGLDYLRSLPLAKNEPQKSVDSLNPQPVADTVKTVTKNQVDELILKEKKILEKKAADQKERKRAIKSSKNVGKKRKSLGLN
jgi:Relaxase/Mobilisation nuclease domain